MNYVEPIRNKEDIKKIREKLFPMYKLIWDIGTNIGLRVSDILNLREEIKDKDYVEVIERKTGKYKKFPLRQDLKQEIKDYIKKYNSKKHSYLYGDKKPLFLGEKGSRLCRSMVYREIKRVCKELNIKVNVGTHTMRKTFGYHHYKQFNDIALLQTIFNHSSPSITLKYIGITQDEINESYRNFKLTPENAVYRDNILKIRQERQNLSTEKYLIKKQKIQNGYIQKIIEEELKTLEINLAFKLEDKLTKIRQKYSEKDILRNYNADSQIADNVRNYVESGGKYADFCKMFLAVI